MTSPQSYSFNEKFFLNHYKQHIKKTALKATNDYVEWWQRTPADGSYRFVLFTNDFSCRSKVEMVKIPQALCVCGRDAAE